jgi:hypothetical protein
VPLSRPHTRSEVGRTHISTTLWSSRLSSGGHAVLAGRFGEHVACVSAPEMKTGLLNWLVKKRGPMCAIMLDEASLAVM